MQVTNLILQPVWYFIFGQKQKRSLASQYAIEHHLTHLINPSEQLLKQKNNEGLIIESSPQLLRQVQTWKLQITVIFLKGQLTLEQRTIKKNYQNVGRCVNIKQNNYVAFRRDLYPRLIILFGPNPIQNQLLFTNYFSFTGYTPVNTIVSANDIIKAFPKQLNYTLFNFKPQLSELNVLQQFFHIKIIHIKHQRSEMSQFSYFFDQQAKIIPTISNKPYYSSIQGNQVLSQIIKKIGQKILPEIIFAYTTQNSEKQAIQKYADDNEDLIHLNLNQITKIISTKPLSYKPTQIQIITSIIYRCRQKKYIILTQFPVRPAQFMQIQKVTRPFKVFADCQKQQNYRPTKDLTPPLYYIQIQKRKKIQLQLPFLNQINTPIKYLIVSGPSCVGKTSASKYISSELSYKHIQYQPYIASIKQKLIAPQDGQQLPFHKIIKHFNTLINNSGNNPILIDGFNVDWKDIDNWVKINGAPVVLNLKTDQKQLIRRTRRKAEADVNAQVTEEQSAKAKQNIAKNTDWADQFSARCPFSTVYNIDFTLPLIQSQKLLAEVLRPRVFLIQSNYALLFQNIAVRYGLAYFNLTTHTLEELSHIVRKGQYRNIIINGYFQSQSHLVCEDFSYIQKNIGNIRYLCVWNHQSSEFHDQVLHLEPPPQPQKPKAVQGQQGGQAPPPPAQEEGQAKKKVFNIYQHQWTKPGNQKNLSQWFLKLKNEHVCKNLQREEVYEGFGQTLKQISQSKQLAIYHVINK